MPKYKPPKLVEPPSVFDSPVERLLKKAAFAVGADKGQFDVTDLVGGPMAVVDDIPRGLGRILAQYRKARQAARPASPLKQFDYMEGLDEIADLAMDRAGPKLQEQLQFARDVLDRTALGTKQIDSAWAKEFLRKHWGSDYLREYQKRLKAFHKVANRPTSAYDYAKSPPTMNRREFLVRQSGVPRRWAREELGDLEMLKDFDVPPEIMSPHEHRVSLDMINREDILDAKLRAPSLITDAAQASAHEGVQTFKEGLKGRAAMAARNRAAAPKKPPLKSRLKKLLTGRE